MSTLERMERAAVNFQDDAGYALRVARMTAEENAKLDHKIEDLERQAQFAREEADYWQKEIREEREARQRDLDQQRDMLESKHHYDIMDAKEAVRREYHNWLNPDEFRGIIPVDKLPRFFVRQGDIIQKIPTIRLVRILTDLGLREAKDVVDRWIADHEAEQREHIEDIAMEAENRWQNGRPDPEKFLPEYGPDEPPYEG